MTNKKFTIAAVAAAAITAAPIAAPIISAISTMPVMAVTTAATTTQVPVSGSVKTIATTNVYYSSDIDPQFAYAIDSGVTFPVVTRATLGNGSVYYVTNAGRYIAAKDVDASSVTTSATNTGDVPTIGEFSTQATVGAVVYDHTGKTTDQVLPADTNAFYTATATINGQKYYKIDDDQYILVSDTVATSVTNTLPGIFTVTAGQSFVRDNTGSYVLNSDNSVKVLPTGSAWKVFGKTTIDGVAYYNLGGNQFVTASDGSFSTKPAKPAKPAKPTLPKPTKFTAVGTVHYVRGYGIQVWTQSHKTVKNNNGTSKKLAHGTSWKIFSKVLIGGETYYNVGGNQWVDSAYINIK